MSCSKWAYTPEKKQEPRKGKWLPVEGTSLQTCSACSFCMNKDNEADNYCPNCGTKMRGEEE